LLLQVFWNDDVSVVENAIFPGCSSLSALTYSGLTDIQKFITLRPFIISGRVNNRWKDKNVFYNSCIWLQVRFPFRAVLALLLPTAARSQVRFSVGVKSFVLKFSWRIQGWPPVMVFQQYDGVFILCTWLFFFVRRVSSRWLHLWSMIRISITLMPPWTLVSICESSSYFGSSKDTRSFRPPIGSARQIVTSISLSLFVLDP
jgi:hypothetical protein